MVMTEIAGVMGAVKAAEDIVKSAIALRDGHLVAAKLGELREKLFDARGHMLEVQTALTDALEEVRSLKSKLADMEKWDAGVDAYKLHQIGRGGMAYILKEPTDAVEPPHYYCTNCFLGRKKSILQVIPDGPPAWRSFRCPACQALIAGGR